MSFYLKKLWLLLAAAFLSFSASGESFRVQKTHSLSLEDGTSRKQISMGVNDALTIKLPSSKVFLQGVELYIQVPQETASISQNISWTLFSCVKPVPSEDRFDYSGTPSLSGTLRNSLGVTIRIPFDSDSSLKKDALSAMSEKLQSIEDGYVFFRLSTTDKNSRELLQGSVELYVRPIFKDSGKLHLNVIFPQDTAELPYSVFIDGTPCPSVKNFYTLEAGMHNVSIVSDYYRNEMRTISIEPAKTTELTVEFQDIKPLLHIAVPEGSILFIDEEKIEDFSHDIIMAVGEHTVKFQMGGYEIIKNFTAVNGRSYTFLINMDALITEEE
ncbi:hypothetical protein [Treponema sp.]|uniref:hypothetical protein n=1 Tax=Treponema sp. TaxID=166 RepID=UPI0025E68AFF|nr:hypothetical protein [Treponema sp.]MCR5218821.1 hypothetical protein [Treponema sp.]